MFFISHGTVAISSKGRHLKEMGEGTYFGDIALFVEARRTATVIAIFIFCKEKIFKRFVATRERSEMEEVVNEERRMKGNKNVLFLSFLSLLFLSPPLCNRFCVSFPKKELVSNKWLK
jgi:hypothetical protein